MDNLTIEADRSVIVCQADTFPDGVMAAFERLHASVPDAVQRTTYGISRPEGAFDNIIYKAAVDEAYEGEGNKLGLDTMIIPAGNYKSRYISDFRKDPSSIGRAFTELLKVPALDPGGFCLEIYQNERDVICAIPLKQEL